MSVEKKKRSNKDSRRDEDDNETARELRYDSPKGISAGGVEQTRSYKRRRGSTDDVEGAGLDQFTTLQQRKLEALAEATAVEEGETIPQGELKRAVWMVNAIQKMRKQYGPKLEALANSVWVGRKTAEEKEAQARKKALEEKEAQARKKALELRTGKTTMQSRTRGENEMGISEKQIGSVVAAVLEGTGLVSAQEAQDGVENVGKGKGGKQGGDVEQLNEQDMLRAKALNTFEEGLLKNWGGGDRKTLELMVRGHDFLANMGMKDATAFRQREFVEKECMKLMIMRTMEEVANFLQTNEKSEFMGQLMEDYPDEIINPEVLHKRLEGMLEMVRIQLMYGEVANRYGWATADSFKERFEKGGEYTAKMDKEASKIAKGKEKPERRARKGIGAKGGEVAAVRTLQHQAPRTLTGIHKGSIGQQQRQQYPSNGNRWVGTSNPYHPNGKCRQCGGNHFARDAVCPFNQGGAGGAGGRGGGAGGGGGAYRGGR
jgi:hypothetical protein